MRTCAPTAPHARKLPLPLSLRTAAAPAAPASSTATVAAGQRGGGWLVLAARPEGSKGCARSRGVDLHLTPAPVADPPAWRSWAGVVMTSCQQSPDRWTIRGGRMLTFMSCHVMACICPPADSSGGQVQVHLQRQGLPCRCGIAVHHACVKVDGARCCCWVRFVVCAEGRRRRLLRQQVPRAAAGAAALERARVCKEGRSPLDRGTAGKSGGRGKAGSWPHMVMALLLAAGSQRRGRGVLVHVKVPGSWQAGAS